MKRILLLLFGLGLVCLGVFTIPFAAAQDFDASVEAIRDTITSDQAALFNVTIENERVVPDSYNVFSLQTDFIVPSVYVVVSGMGEESIQLKMFPQKTEPDFYGVSFFVKSDSTGESVKKTVRVKIVDLNKSIGVEIKPRFLKKEEKKFRLVVKNTEKLSLENATIVARTDFFSEKFSFSLGPYETKNFTIFLEEEDTFGGSHLLEVSFYEAEKLSFRKVLPFRVESLLDVKKKVVSSGIFVKEVNVVLRNEGNVVQEFAYEMPTNYFTHVFSSFSSKPELERSGGKLVDVWKVALHPDEKFTVNIKTNYALPLIAVILLAVGIFLAIVYLSKPLFVSKKIQRVGSKKGFAFKIILKVQNKKSEIKSVKVRDYLPHIAKLHEEFGTVRPDKVTERYLEWDITSMQPGEERVFSYILYSEVEVLGALKLPRAVVFFERAGKTDSVYSNSLTAFA